MGHRRGACAEGVGAEVIGDVRDVDGIPKIIRADEMHGEIFAA